MRIAHQMQSQDIEPMRRCHDCGRPTWNYRCVQCWRKLRRAMATDAGHARTLPDACSLPPEVYHESL